MPNYLLCTCVVLRTTCRPKLTCVRAAASASPSYNLVYNYILPFFRYRSCVKMSSTNVCMHEKRASVISRVLAGLFPLLTHQMLRHREREEIVYECVLHMLYIVVVFCSPAGLCVTQSVICSLSLSFYCPYCEEADSICGVIIFVRRKKERRKGC